MAIIDQGQDEFGEGLPPQPAVAQSRSAAANLSHHMATSHNEALGLIPPVQVKQGKRSKRGSPFKKKYGSTSNGNLPLCLPPAHSHSHSLTHTHTAQSF